MAKMNFILCGLFATILLVHGLPAPVEVGDVKELDANGNEDSDLKPAETFGFGFYPGGYYGGGLGYGYGRGYYGRSYYGGYGGWGYGGYRGYSGYYRRPIYPVWG